jgi:hypothetical protein
MSLDNTVGLNPFAVMNYAKIAVVRSDSNWRRGKVD